VGDLPLPFHCFKNKKTIKHEEMAAKHQLPEVALLSVNAYHFLFIVSKINKKQSNMRGGGKASLLLPEAVLLVIASKLKKQ